MGRLNSLNEWIDYVFDRPADRRWWLERDESGARLDWFQADPTTMATFVAELFEHATVLIDRFGLKQIAHGFDYIDSTCFERALADAVPPALQERWIRAVFPLVRDLFAPRMDELEWPCSSIVRFSAFQRAGTSPWYMHLRPAVLQVLGEVIELSEPECRLDAAWSLVSLRQFAPADVDRLLTGFLASSHAGSDESLQELREALAEPAASARSLTFDQWVEYVFDHPVNEPDAKSSWWHERDEDGKRRDWWEPQPIVAADYLARLFEQPAFLVARHNGAQIDQGFWYLLSSTVDGHAQAALDDAVPIACQQRWIRATYTVFRDLLAKQCTVSFGHCSWCSPERPHRLNSSCYMWWDMGNLYKVVGSVWYKHLVEPAFDVLQQTLALDSPACQEGALHGLGHAHRYQPQRVQEIIARHLPHIHPGLHDYARAAMVGRVQ